jgi:16S rRNA G966 N2-methylase RsmD
LVQHKIHLDNQFLNGRKDEDRLSFVNQLFYGDNLEVLKLPAKDESVDLVYLDPPFKSNQDYMCYSPRKMALPPPR